MNIYDTDPEFAEIFKSFAYGDIAENEKFKLEAPTRYKAVLAALIGCQGVEAFRAILPEALKNSVTPVEVKEIVYQSAAYSGFGRCLPFLNAVNEILIAEGVELPLESQATAGKDSRLAAGTGAQSEIFGAHMKEAWKNGDMNRFLAENCFGDYYTRRGLSLKEREMVTFCLIMAQGGCEPQLTAHAKGNMNMGNDKNFLMKVIFNCLPYIGYPRSLNAAACVNSAEK